jgi:hypothetical protein
VTLVGGGHVPFRSMSPPGVLARRRAFTAIVVPTAERSPPGDRGGVWRSPQPEPPFRAPLRRGSDETWPLHVRTLPKSRASPEHIILAHPGPNQIERRRKTLHRSIPSDRAPSRRRYLGDSRRAWRHPGRDTPNCYRTPSGRPGHPRSRCQCRTPRGVRGDRHTGRRYFGRRKPSLQLKLPFKKSPLKLHDSPSPPREGWQAPQRAIREMIRV